MNEWLCGDYVKADNGRIYQIVRVHGDAVYLEDLLTGTRLIRPQSDVLRISPRETARVLVEAWLSSDFFAID